MDKYVFTWKEAAMFARALLSLLLAAEIGISGVLQSAKETKVKNRRIDETLYKCSGK